MCKPVLIVAAVAAFAALTATRPWAPTSQAGETRAATAFSTYDLTLGAGPLKALLVDEHN